MDFHEKFSQDHDPGNINFESWLNYLRAVASKQRDPVNSFNDFLGRKSILSSDYQNYTPNSLEWLENEDVVNTYMSMDIDFDSKLRKFH